MTESTDIWTGKASSYDRARPTPPPALLFTNPLIFLHSRVMRGRAFHLIHSLSPFHHPHRSVVLPQCRLPNYVQAFMRRSQAWPL